MTILLWRLKLLTLCKPRLIMKWGKTKKIANCLHNMKFTLAIPLILSLLLSQIVKGQEVVTYQLDISKTELVWKGEKLTGYHYGNLVVSNGFIKWLNNAPVEVKVEIDMNSMTCSDLSGSLSDKLISHLKSKEFFDVENFGKAIFYSDSFTRIENDSFLVSGNLTIKGISNKISFNAEISRIENEILSSAKVVFDRTLWNIRYGSDSFFDNLGDKTIYDDITLDFSLIAH